jgi:predicted kinase
VFNNLLIEYVSSGYDVVINNINLRKKYRDDYKKLLSKYNVRWVYVVVEAPSIEDNISRRQGQVPEDVLRNMYSGFVMPSPDEYDEIIHYKQTK